MKKLIALLLLSTQIAFAGLPPTTTQGANDASAKVKFNLQAPYSQITDLGGTKAQIETGNKNYIKDPGFENPAGPSADGWNTYANTAQPAPVNGSGGSPTHVSIARTMSGPLDGASSFLIANAGGSSAQGEGTSFDFTIPAGQQTHLLNISFLYEQLSGTFVPGTNLPGSAPTTGDMDVWIYDVTNSVLIQPVSNILTCASTSTSCTFNGAWQAPSNSTSFRLIFHVAGTNTSAWAMKVDNLSVAPVVYFPQNIITEWQSYPLTITGSSSNPTPGTYTSLAEYRRVGDSVEILYNFAQTNASGSVAGSGTYLFPLPTGLTANTAKVTLATGSNGAGGTVVGSSFAGNTGTNASTSAGVGAVELYNSTNLMLTTTTSGAGQVYGIGSGYIPMTTTNAYYQFHAVVPIQGWGSTAQTSDLSSEGRTVAASLGGIPTGGLTSSLMAVTFPTITKDTFGSYRGSTYTVAKGSWCTVQANLGVSATFASSNFDVTAIYKNGSLFKGEQNNNGNSTQTYITDQIASSDYYNAGDTIQIYHSTSGTSPSYSATSGYQWLSILCVPGPSTITPSESVNASAYNTSGQSLTSGSQVTITGWTVQFDSHCALSTSGVYTVKSPGKYRATLCDDIATGFTANTGQLGAAIVQAGSVSYSATGVTPFGATTTIDTQACITHTFNCQSLDTLTLQGYQTNGTARSLYSSDSTRNSFSIERVGN